ncbi:MAG TPA: M23 family metallopeptidase [Gemmatimonadaceae bacterium]|nr:M23 family metallopeptidase [Gemmatimonadaceae bacterium]
MRRTPMAAARTTASVTPISSRRIAEQPPRPKKAQGWTLMLVPPPTGGTVRSYQLRRWQMRFLVVLLCAALAGSLVVGGTLGARFGSEPFATLDSELADAELRAAAYADTLRALRIVGSTTPSPTAAPSSGALELRLPVAGRISSRFTRARLHPILGIYRPHLGLDLSAPRGTRITSPAPGRVRFVGRQLAAGLVVEIDHGGGVVSRYMHCRSAVVKEGQQVVAGTTIATVGSSGLSTGPHLHWEVRVNGRAVDPLKYRFATATPAAPAAAPGAAPPPAAPSNTPPPAARPAS